MVEAEAWETIHDDRDLRLARQLWELEEARSRLREARYRAIELRERIHERDSASEALSHLRAVVERARLV